MFVTFVMRSFYQLKATMKDITADIYLLSHLNKIIRSVTVVLYYHLYTM